MPEEKRDPREMLEEAIRKRDELNTFIRVYQELLGQGESVSVPGSNASQETRVDPSASDFDPLSVVYPGMFFGKSQPQAVQALLEKVKPRPLKTRTIIEALAKGGSPVGGKKPAVNLWGVLGRNKKLFILVPKAGWGLVEWYEPAVIAKMRSQPAQEAEEEDAKKPEVA